MKVDGRSSRMAAKEGPLQLTLALFKPTLCSYQPDVSAVLRHIKRSQLDIVRTTKQFWTRQEAADFYKEHEGKFYYPRLVASMSR